MTPSKEDIAIMECMVKGWAESENRGLYGNISTQCVVNFCEKYKLKIPKDNRECKIAINGNNLIVDALHNNTVYEYNGIFWHGHPDYYDPDVVHPICGKTFGELYEATLRREDIIKSAGYKLVSKWGR